MLYGGEIGHFPGEQADQLNPLQEMILDGSSDHRNIFRCNIMIKVKDCNEPTGTRL